jgi:multidrug efflux pump subunit AcrA (membrane-fusion protein)
MRRTVFVGPVGLCAWVCLAVAAVGPTGCRAASTSRPGASSPPGTVTLQRGTFVRQVRATGTTEAVRAATTAAPRLAGQSTSLVVTRLVAGGTRVKPGDLLVEFDRQDQLRAALDRRAEYLDLEQQILRKQAEQEAARAADETALTVAEHDVGRARLDVEKNQFLARIDAEKNSLTMEQASARLAQLRQAMALKARSASAEIRILEIRRGRAQRAWRNAEGNANLMMARAPFDGLAVLRSTFKGSQMAEVQEGDEVYAGSPVVDVVDPARMQVRARISQVDGGAVAAGQPATIHLDAYPDLSFDGRVEQMAPLAAASSLTPRVRMFAALIAIDGAHVKLMPDLSAAVDIVVQRQENVLVLPREAVVIGPDGAWVMTGGPGRGVRTAVTLGAVGVDQVVVTGGLTEGAVVARHAAGGGR